MNLMIPGWEDVLRMLIPMCTVICVAGAILLLLFAEGSRSRRLLAYVMLAWGVVYAVRILGILLGFMGFMKTDILDPFVMVSGNLYAIVLLWYPLEVVRPGWLNLKRCLLLTSPYLLVVGVYYTVLYLLGESPVRLEDWSSFLAGIGRFNIWYRLVILLSVIAYIAYQLLIIYRYEVSYREWCDMNYASAERMEISWLRYYGLGVILIVFAFFWVLLDGNTYCFVVHNLIVQLFFSFVFFRGLFHENPYPEGFFRHTMDEEEALKEEEQPHPVIADGEVYEVDCEVSGNSCEKIEEEQGKSVLNETVFLTRLPEYKAEVQRWLEEGKPYLRKDFKLMEVAKVIPLNRTYLSQIFNEGWGTSFSNVVCDYRIRHAERLLKSCPDLTVNQIALLCGFASSAVLHRAFAKHRGITPKQYRNKAINT